MPDAEPPAPPSATPMLQGLRVLAVEQHGAGPFGTLFLADHGAEVIEIENQAEGGDIARAVGPYFPDKLSATGRQAPTLGADTDAILHEAGFSRADVDRLRTAGAI